MSTALTESRYGYKPLGSLPEKRREEIVRGALAKLSEEATLFDVAAHYKISRPTLMAALNEYAEEEWRGLQIARAQVAVQKAQQKRAELCALLDGFHEAEKGKKKTTETAMTYPRIREQLRIAEHDERSAMWHLERLYSKIYGTALKVEGSMTLKADETLIGFASDLLKAKRPAAVLENEPGQASDRMVGAVSPAALPAPAVGR